MRYWLGAGSNIGDGRRHIGEAWDRLEREPGMSLLRVSSMYCSRPWGFTRQADFINAVAEVSSSLSPLVMLERLQGIERALGRQRIGPRWGPRTIDLDILLAGDLVMNLPQLMLPHPELHRRAFVLAPLAELEPALLVPGHGSIADLLEGLADQGVERLAPPDAVKS